MFRCITLLMQAFTVNIAFLFLSFRLVYTRHHKIVTFFELNHVASGTDTALRLADLISQSSRRHQTKLLLNPSCIPKKMMMRRAMMTLLQKVLSSIPKKMMMMMGTMMTLLQKVLVLSFRRRALTGTCCSLAK